MSRRPRPGTLIMGTGGLLTFAGLAWYWLTTPVIVLGGGQALGRVDGDAAPTIRVGLLNLRREPIYVQGAKVGCSVDDLQIQANTLDTVWLDCPISLAGVPAGRRNIAVTIRGFQAGKPIAIPTYVSAEVYRNVQ